MYTLKLESVSRETSRAAQVLVQESSLWSYDIDIATLYTTVSLSTSSIRELKRLVDLLEAEEFMCNEQA